MATPALPLGAGTSERSSPPQAQAIQQDRITGGPGGTKFTSPYAPRRYGSVGKRQTGVAGVGQIPRQMGDPEDCTGWQILALPFRKEMEGQWTGVDVEVVVNGKPVVIKVAFTKVAMSSLKGLQRKPPAGWEGRFDDFPDGIPPSPFPRPGKGSRSDLN